MSTPNWAKLVAQGRARDVGVPWNDTELVAIYEFSIPAAYVRRGCLTQEAYRSMQEEDAAAREDGKPNVETLTRGELEAKAKELEIEFTPDTDDETLRTVVEKAAKKAEKAAATAAKKAEKGNK